MSVPNCEGCEEDYNYLLEFIKDGKGHLYFAGKGLYEKGHLMIIIVNDKGELIAW